MSNKSMAHRFNKLATKVASACGNYKTFISMLVLVLLWTATGPLFHFSNSWQLPANTITSIITFLMVFLIQNTQNRDSLATHLKLDELIRAIETANDEVMRAEDETDEKMEELKRTYQQLSKEKGSTG